MVKTEQAIIALRECLGDRTSIAAAVRQQHCSTLTWLACEAPDIVVWPQTVGEVQSIVKIALQYQLPLIAYGAGTSLEGQVNAPFGGISVDFSRMNHIWEVNVHDHDVTLEPGVTLQQLNYALRDTGLFFPVDPGSDSATLGGMASTRASGTTTVKYGAMRENVLRAKIVLADGQVIQTGSRAKKSSAGYDLTRLIVGSEGTLGLIVGLTLRLFPRPETVLSSVYSFPNLKAAAETTLNSFQIGLLPSRIELLDSVMLEVINTQSKTEFPKDGPALFVEFEGTEKATEEHHELFQDMALRHGAKQLLAAHAEQERKLLWKARHDCFWSVRSFWPQHSFVVTDVCVPLSKLWDCLSETMADISAHQLTAPLLGHIGDGNFHCIVVVNPQDKRERERLESFLANLAQRAIAMEGTCTGEHGIGQGKVRYLVEEAGGGVGVMQALKKALDPHNIFNPGKIFFS
ncbi:MAG: FAD-binding oxidoreductase [Hyphomicrobium sp.]